MHEMDRPYIANWIIIVFLILFFPITIVLVMIRSKKHRGNIPMNIADSRFYGKIWLAIYALSLIVAISPPYESIDLHIRLVVTYSLLFLWPGIHFLRKSKRLQKEWDNAQKHHNVIHQQVPPETPEKSASPKPSRTEASAKYVECANCGATSPILLDENKHCEYCNSPLRYAN